MATQAHAQWVVSAIVTTYNRSDHVRLCLASLETQSVRPHEVIIADDGSDPEHVAVIEQLIAASPLKPIYARREHQGFGAAANRNNGVRHSTGDYLFFVDSDLVLFPDVLERHLAASGPRRWVTGYCVPLTQQETLCLLEELIRSGRLAELWPPHDTPRCVKLRKDHRNYRLNILRAWLWPSERRLRKLRLLTGQASMPRAAFERVNGFDENFQQWGCEDLDLGLRLQLAGFRASTVMSTSRAYHLYHEPALRAERTMDYYRRPREGRYRCDRGLHKDPGSGK